MPVRRKKAAFFINWVLCLLLAGGAFGEAAYSPIYPEAPGDKTLGNETVVIDISHVDLGYFMVKHAGSSKRLKVTTKFSGDETEYKFDLNGDGVYEVYPLSRGSGKYQIAVYEHAGTGKNTYARIFNKSVKVQLQSDTIPFLVPNQYVWYSAANNAVAKSTEICQGLTSDYDKLTALYDFVSTTIRYDYVKAVMVQKPYLPVVDQTLSEETGICFDYSALLACMLRVQGIPTQLVIGKLMATNPPGCAHAWNKVYINGTWSLVDATFRDAGFKQSDYVEERVY